MYCFLAWPGSYLNTCVICVVAEHLNYRLRANDAAYCTARAVCVACSLDYARDRLGREEAVLVRFCTDFDAAFRAYHHTQAAAFAPLGFNDYFAGHYSYCVYRIAYIVLRLETFSYLNYRRILTETRCLCKAKTAQGRFFVSRQGPKCTFYTKNSPPSSFDIRFAQPHFGMSRASRFSPNRISRPPVTSSAAIPIGHLRAWFLHIVGV